MRVCVCVLEEEGGGGGGGYRISPTTVVQGAIQNALSNCGGQGTLTIHFQHSSQNKTFTSVLEGSLSSGNEYTYIIQYDWLV